EYLTREKIAELETKMMGATLAELGEPDQTAESTETLKFQFNRDTTSPGEVEPTPRIYIPIKDRRWVMGRARGQCEIICENGKRCTRRTRIKMEHIRPLFLGGKNKRSNYRAVCKSHNLLYAKKHMGK